jgi:hypothetical protein
MSIQNILLTNIHLKDFAGTELNTLYLAKELKREGFNVDVATLVSGDPLVSHFQREQIPVFTMPEINQKHYDLIFANHFPVLTYCLTTANMQADKIVYLLNSSFISIEAPPEYINNLTYCLAVGNFLLPQLKQYGVDEEKIRLFPNFLTEDEIVLQGNPGKELKKLAVISNHVPEVVYQAVEILRGQGIVVDIYGVRDTYKLLSPQDLIAYDGIVSIGKSTYWALGIGIPVFCFDHFGGPGWITEENISTAHDHIFSGKGFDPVSPTPEQLSDQIMDGYTHGLAAIDECQAFIISRCRLSTNIQNLIREIKNEPVINDPFAGFSKEVLERRNRAVIEFFQLATEYHQFEIELTNSLGWKLLSIGRKIFGRPYRFLKQLLRKNQND